MPNEIRGGGWGVESVSNSELDTVTFDEFYPRVHIYKNLLPNASRLVEILKESSEDRASSYYFNKWDKWHVFGETIGWVEYNPIYPDLPVNQERKSEEEELLRELADAFRYSTQHYMRFHGVQRGDDWTTMGPSICRYVAEMDHCGVEELSMKYHTDYDFMRGDEPGDKFAITCTMYLNDEYEGGEMWFALDHPGDSFGEEPLPEEKIHVYKPQAGDVLVFPSGHPDVLSEESTYFHGVSRTSRSEEKPDDKFFIRSYHMIPFEGTPEWNANKEKYGAEVWEAMELERLKARVKTHEELQILKTRTAASDKECGLH